ncbi:MAG: NusA family KH domain protein [Methanomicrobiales archaeon 53_19]|jgi:N utilization substance protein A|uniref:NusA-like transcription termination signal-binding factor n=1 Tax=Methanocalculus sp. TaxID=2004547 RepID=UPI000749F0BD|nr:NusA-like transcription termination signal-binding factor [Methanocalculus sp.]KUK69596.1 MAG: NusA family KH domain protein [Methanocalculus sp. 52_23]KUL04581.1 MAG: NusA family KH domain protein [Methanomicrobiales archaeon 53_19]HIJ06803.1 NusA-like transcription termination signal-binding factor [Methanocalculus sp.]
MSEITLTEDCMRLISQFESLTGAGARDCVIDDRHNRVIFIINPGEMGLAIGRKGASIKKASEALDKRVEVVEYSDDLVQFIRNCFLPAEVLSIEFEGEDEERVAQVEVREEDRGLAIGKEGKNITKAKQLLRRQFDIADVELIQE